MVVVATVAESRLGFFFGRSVAGRLRLGEIPPPLEFMLNMNNPAVNAQREG